MNTILYSLNAENQDVSETVCKWQNDEKDITVSIWRHTDITDILP